MTTTTQSPTQQAVSWPFSWPYTEQHNSTIFNKKIEYKDGTSKHIEMLVANFVAKITAEIISEDGKRFFEIKGTLQNGRSFCLEINDDDFSSEQKLKAAILRAAGSKAVVAAGMSNHLAPAIQRFTVSPIQIRRYDRTGWAEDKFLIPGKQDANTKINLPRKLAYEIDPKADFNLGLKAMEALLLSGDAEQLTILTAFIFQGPIAKTANLRESDRYGLFVAGQSGTFKTSTCQCAMAIWGNKFMDDENLIRFGDGATRLSMQKHATHAYDLPLFIDNYKPNVPPGEAGFIALLHTTVEGGEKDRLDQTGKLRESEPIYTWPVFTGEDLPSSDTASLARLLKIDWNKINPAKLSEAQKLSFHLSAIGGAWLDFVGSTQGKQIIKNVMTDFETTRLKWAEILRNANANTQNPYRVASNLAINELTWKIMSHLDSPIGTLARSHDFEASHISGLEKIAQAMAQETAASLEATRFLEALPQIIFIKDDEFYTRVSYTNDGVNITDTTNRSNFIGWQDANGIYLLTDIARKAIEDVMGKNALNKVSNTKIYQQLKSLDLIEKEGSDGRTLYPKKRAGKTLKVLWLKRNALD